SLLSLSRSRPHRHLPSFPTRRSSDLKFIDDIEQTPARLRAAIQGLSPQQIETPYREGGWTVRQVVHHVPESHMNAYIRFKLALKIGRAHSELQSRGHLVCRLLLEKKI